ncbi:hypothetical protein C5O19_19830 [Siphonobacter curvatus]|uniref:Uncharacterized protein n=1 Tax=Siphonobacter curvatus TaxID=2094562 RepID=A0A2S7IIA0_9BACT|nr:hypothetical protein C5O19_19830 [Siphonobacter curvatus]
MDQHELIADRTKKALAEIEKRGFVLGTPADETEQTTRKVVRLVSLMPMASPSDADSFQIVRVLDLALKTLPYIKVLKINVQIKR